ncbi:PIG-L family deacetylase [Candidatus Dojkabacteria bacterium]|uniref:PIG-L family deacetylase n=1 Tax=Candidatus Dojkabacteria bacterium TaxID=2099670 RepID=A0A3M0Z002_9BACT|nr:MAG: PIG-L family deacetylase [Candidatus Dojkabacteria bacterium]
MLTYLLVITLITCTTVAFLVWFNHPNHACKKINPDFKKTLFIYPHPDDETIFSGGTIALFCLQNKDNVFIVSVTSGQRGDEKLKISESQLKKVRTREFIKAMGVLGAKNYQVWKFMDGETEKDELKIEQKIRQFIEDHNIERLVTYEKYGVYGHPDHICISKICTKVAEDKEAEIWYATLPDKILRLSSLPSEIKYKDKKIQLSPQKVVDPNHYINIFSLALLWRKYKAASKYKSQVLSKRFPLWVTILSNWKEYYYIKTYKKNH